LAVERKVKITFIYWISVFKVNWRLRLETVFFLNDTMALVSTTTDHTPEPDKSLINDENQSNIKILVSTSEKNSASVIQNAE
jgi:hypothetical protein